MKKPPPQPRPDLIGRSFGTAHQNLYVAMRGFLRDLERAEREYRDEIEAQRAKLRIDAQYAETPEVERYSLAVQLFAAFTVEAAISLYTVLKFGGDEHDSHFRRGSAIERLQKALHHAGIKIDDDAEILKVVGSIMSARHPIAHPFSVEYYRTGGGTMRSPDRPWPDVTAAAARRALAQVDRFLELMRQLDEPESLMFTVF